MQMTDSPEELPRFVIHAAHPGESIARFPIKMFHMIKATETHPQRNLLHGRFSFPIAEEQHALFTANHESCRNRRLILQHGDAVRTLEQLLVTLHRIHVQDVQALGQLATVPPDDLTVSSAREEFRAGLAVDPQHRVDAVAVTNFARCASNCSFTSSRIPSATLTVRLSADENVCVLLMVLDADRWTRR